jgi:hypothetical protein
LKDTCASQAPDCLICKVKNAPGLSVKSITISATICSAACWTLHAIFLRLLERGRRLKAQQAKLRSDLPLQLEPGMRVLDIGCGWGGLAYLWREITSVRRRHHLSRTAKNGAGALRGP